MGRVSESQKWQKRTHTHTQTEREREEMVQFFCETPLSFCFVLLWGEFFPSLYHFLDAHAILVVKSPTYALHVDTLPV